MPREEIPAFLADLQAAIAALRKYRDNLIVPEPGHIADKVTPLLVRHRDLALRYIDDPVYRAVLERAIAARVEG